MKRYLLDTGPAGDFINRRGGVRERVQAETMRGNRVGICLPVLAELWYGVENSASRDLNEGRLQRALPELLVWPLTTEAAKEYGRLSTELRRLGRPMQQIDILIAAVALSLGNTVVVSSDGDMVAVPGLTVENWAMPRSP